MYCVVYEFSVVRGQEKAFEESWAKFTEAIFRVKGSLGSRLHKTSQSDVYVAYAQWASRETFEMKTNDELFSNEEIEARETMKSTLENSKVVYKLDLIDDHLRHL